MALKCGINVDWAHFFRMFLTFGTCSNKIYAPCVTCTPETPLLIRMIYRVTRRVTPDLCAPGYRSRGIAPRVRFTLVPPIPTVLDIDNMTLSICPWTYT